MAVQEGSDSHHVPSHSSNMQRGTPPVVFKIDLTLSGQESDNVHVVLQFKEKNNTHILINFYFRGNVSHIKHSFLHIHKIQRAEKQFAENQNGGNVILSKHKCKATLK